MARLHWNWDVLLGRFGAVMKKVLGTEGQGAGKNRYLFPGCRNDEYRVRVAAVVVAHLALIN